MPRGPPGSLGLPLISDNSLSFYRDPIAFVRKQISKHGPLFQARLLNSATVFITEYYTAKDALSLPESELSASIAYQPFMSSVYGDETIIMAQGRKHTSLSQRMVAAMSPELFQRCQDRVDAVVRHSLSNLECKQDPIDVYQTLKASSMGACFQLLLQLDDEDPLNLELPELAKSHWHGITSLPASFNLGFGFKSSMAKSQEAKDELLRIIQERIEQIDDDTGVLASLVKNLHLAPADCAKQLLLLVSALVPKAFSSILTNMICQLSACDDAEVLANVDNVKWLQSAIKEAHRLEPPFIGMRRIVVKDGGIELGGYTIAKDTVVMIMLPFVNSDPAIFSNPKRFLPERFLSTSEPDPLTFGFGTRPCVGEGFVQTLMITMAREIFRQYKFQRVDQDEAVDVKWLPVARPAKPILAVVQCRHAHHQHD
eukprot:m.33369 g.33369  ORF g.33369 m.33369 type:complete len:427 (-) comp12226_c0_seq3:20-1300(-)